MSTTHFANSEQNSLAPVLPPTPQRVEARSVSGSADNLGYDAVASHYVNARPACP